MCCADEKKALVCASCGQVIDCKGWGTSQDGEEFNVCEDCVPMFKNAQEFRVCETCGKPFSEGYMSEEGFFYACESCFVQAMNDSFGESCWRSNEHSDEPDWCGGYYDYRVRGDVWFDTGVYYTDFA